MTAVRELVTTLNAGCGSGKDGFQPGNTCAKGGKGSGAMSKADFSKAVLDIVQTRPKRKRIYATLTDGKTVSGSLGGYGPDGSSIFVGSKMLTSKDVRQLSLEKPGSEPSQSVPKQYAPPEMEYTHAGKRITVRPSDDLVRTVAEWQEPQMEVWAKERGVSTDKLRKDWSAKAQRACDKAKMYVAVPDEYLEAILLDGRIKPMAETGHSTGIDWVDLEEGKTYRQGSDKEMYGYDESIPASARPISGYLADSDPHFNRKVDYGYADGHDSAKAYGLVTVELKSPLRNRATVTFGDSLNYGQDQLLPTPLTKVDYRSLDVGNKEGKGLDLVKKGTVDAVSRHRDYAEIQVHGGVATSDIKTVWFMKSPPPQIQTLLKKRGIPWKLKNPA